MKRKVAKPAQPAPRRYSSPDIPMAAIRRFARSIAEQFHPEKIILFGSYAYGTPNQDSDIDLLVVMPARNQIDQAIKIRLAVAAPFPLDLIVRTPHNMRWRLEAGDWFLREIVSQGKVLYDRANGRMGPKSRGRLSSRATTRARGKTVS